MRDAEDRILNLPLMDHGVMVTHKILVLIFWVRIPVVQQNCIDMATTGYKAMLRDRCPTVVNYALKWQKAKERWVDHAYKNFIRIYVKKEERYNATRITLGIAKYFRNFEFDKSIDWENLTKEEKEYWSRVSSWVGWFVKKYAYIENAYEISKKTGKSDIEIKIDIIGQYLSALLPSEHETEEMKQAKFKYVDNLVDFLIKCFEGRI